jgi:glutamate racemase
MVTAATNPRQTPRSSPDGSSAIGVFDSGIGGLTVARELMRQLPNESIIYFGDTARVPYGPKSPETVVRYSREITSFLRDQGVKAVVVACNTATAHALPTLRAEYDLPIIGVIEPGSRAAARATRSGSVGVIGTLGTIGSRAYERAIAAERPTARITVRACPLFVPRVEEGWLEGDATSLIAREYLGGFVDAQVDTLVLGCTHYPLLKRVIGDVVGRGVRLIDSAEETAAETAAVLRLKGLERADNEAPQYRFIASDVPDQFLRVGQRFLGTAIDNVETFALG